MLLYEITVNNYKYYGITEDYHKRYARHINDLRSGKHHNVILQRSFNRNPVFRMDILVDGIESRELANILERKYIDQNECVNMTLGGDGGDTISAHPNKRDIIERANATKKNTTIVLSEAFIASQGSIASRAEKVWAAYTCSVCGKSGKGVANYLRYHEDNCGIVRRWYNNGSAEKFAVAAPDDTWNRGRLRTNGS